MIGRIKVNQYLVERSIFPGGEVYVDVKLRNEENNLHSIYASIWDSDDLMALMMTIDSVQRQSNDPIALYLWYLPYGRQDRVFRKGESHSLKVFARMLNSMNLYSVNIVDPHSDVAEALIDRVNVIKPTSWINQSIKSLLKKHESISLVAGDSSCYKRMKRDGYSQEIIPVIKDRDFVTGDLSLIKVFGGVIKKHLLIVDDICDGGATFLKLADILKRNGALSINLYVTHGIFSQGFSSLRENIDHIYCVHTKSLSLSAISDLV